MEAKLIVDGKPFRGKNLVGEEFNRLKVLEFGRRKSCRGGTVIYWNCICDCGNQLEVQANKLVSGHTQSCGCYQQERATQAKTVHGCASRQGKHPIYESWRAMMARCYDEKSVGWKWYGGRGIAVCERWHNFAPFKGDMLSTWESGLSIERKSTNGNYTPENCKWASAFEQSRNRRNNVVLTHGGETMCLTDWSTRVGIRSQTLGSRLQMGWSIEDALFTKAAPYHPERAQPK